MFAAPTLPLLVFTDLDGTLLDHDDYGFAPALPALQALHDAAVPLIPTTSKTLAEVAALNRQLDNLHPFIVENGGAIVIPDGYFPRDDSDEPYRGHRIHPLGRPYAEIIEVLTELRGQGYRFEGFHDMTVTQITQQTGLSTAQAELAAQRLCSEPMHWQDSDEALTAFEHQLARHGLSITRGGRFLHVKDDTDKARAMLALCELYRQAGFNNFQIVAFGDSANDIEMLEHADIAAVIRRKSGSALQCHGRQQTVVSEQPGPSGWNTLMLQILQSIGRPTAPLTTEQIQR